MSNRLDDLGDDDLDLIVGGYRPQAPPFASASLKVGPYGADAKYGENGLQTGLSANTYGLSLFGVGISAKVDTEGHVSGGLGFGPVSIGLDHTGLSVAAQASLVKAELGGVGINIGAKIGVEHITPENVYADLKYQNEHPLWYLEQDTPVASPRAAHGPELWGPDGPHPVGPQGNPIDGQAISHLIDHNISLDHAQGVVVPGFSTATQDYGPQVITGVSSSTLGGLHFDTQAAPLASTTGELLSSLGYTPSSASSGEAVNHGTVDPHPTLGPAHQDPGGSSTHGAPAHFASPAQDFGASTHTPAPAHAQGAPAHFASPAHDFGAAEHPATPTSHVQSHFGGASQYSASAGSGGSPVNHHTPSATSAAPQAHAAPAHFASPARDYSAAPSHTAPAAHGSPAHQASPANDYGAASPKAAAAPTTGSASYGGPR